ncbi:dihydroxyacetone kinase family protein [Lichenicoccus roseus]|uniref:Dihydroxyacetone kinase family protein n=1 Tax=Lichenicoccus roseus TaxID=2683649 RepID=A0A5R9JDE8_9PROT|nr:dihydroxyacetone kinase family protein [Lichenicoccus roseus]TLU73426.1 dihydroxyacetone kinase family protein [Lichenicoccus roseus]
MTHLHDDPTAFAATALAGYCDVFRQFVRAVPDGVVRSTATPDGKVALVIGGGSGHYPAFAGYVGPGLADAAVAGDVFASPSTRAVRDICARAHRGGGILLGFGNYAGDVLNFGLAAERLRGEGIDVRVLAVSDDVASASAEEHERRRGVAGDLAVFKIAGAAAEAGRPLDEVERIARLANARTRSFGVAFGGCTLPGAKQPLFSVPEGRMAIGLGIHGEPGIDEVPIPSAAELAAILVDRLLSEAPAHGGKRVAAILNGLGSTKYEELFVLWSAVASRLAKAGLAVVAPEVGEFVTSLDMEGCSLTLTWLDDELETCWLAPCDSAVLRRGATIAAEPAAIRDEAEVAAKHYPEASAEGRAGGRCIAGVMAHLADILRDAEQELGRIDAQAGDGDHGQGMARGSAAAAAAAKEAAEAGAGASSVLAAAADAWADRAGGTSGAIWGVGLRSWSQSLGDDAPIDAGRLAAGALAALSGVTRLGGAKPGDKTLVDALEPFARTLEAEVSKGSALRAAWQAASDAATGAAKQTADLVPRLGRARPLAERSKGHPDAGAISLAMAARAVLDRLPDGPG